MHKFVLDVAKPRMVPSGHVDVFVVQNHQTALPDLVNERRDSGGKVRAWRRSMGLQPLQPIDIENVDGRKVRQRPVGFTCDVNLPVRGGPVCLSVDLVTLGGVGDSLPRRHPSFVGVNAPSIGSIIASFHHHVNEGMASIADQTKTGMMMHGGRRMRDDQRPVFGHSDGQSKLNRRTVSNATAPSLEVSSNSGHAHQMHLGW